MTDASDVITYIGVPLAVLGVLPIFYTFLNSFLTLRNIKRSLKKCKLEATTRGSFMAGIVEVSLPRFSITPLSRTEDAYWTEATKTSTLKGGTWTLFHWNQLITSHAMQRVQYSSDLRIPQAEIDLEELYEFLLDRGAVPDVKGIHMLRVSGLWTPTGTSLMLSPDATQSVLRISLPDDSDGVLSLAVQWKPEWNRRNHSSLPPGWMRLEFPTSDPSKQKCEAVNAVQESVLPSKSSPIKDDSEDAETFKAKDLERPLSNLPPPPPPPPSYSPRSTSLRFRLTSSPTHPYLQFRSPAYEHNHKPLYAAPLPSLEGTRPTTSWLSPLSLLHSLSSPNPTTFLTLPPFLHALSLASSIPCGVLVLAHLLSPNDAPEWETPDPPNRHAHEVHERFILSQQAIKRERLLPEPQREAAGRLRRSEELSAMVTRTMREQRERAEREERREREAIGSQRVGVEVVAGAALGYLEGEGEVVDDDDSGQGTKDAGQVTVERLLVGIYWADVGIDVAENGWAVDACAMLDRWRDWSERGGMNKEDLRAVLRDKKSFCWAAVAVGLVAKVCEKERADGGGLLRDVRECLRVWKKVRLG